MSKRKTINIISLGCSKNLVDSEILMRRLGDVGFRVVFEETADRHRRHDITVINTCGFIGDAKEESVNTILRLVDAKAHGFTGQVIVMGCLSERYRKELPEQIPEVDRWYGKYDWSSMVKDLSRQFPATLSYDRILTSSRHSAYVKISEGCDRFCAFCAIPLITGRHHSRPVDEILDEVKLLASRGVNEINVIAQDLSAYGTDLPTEQTGRSNLAFLIDSMSRIDGIEWIRLHYAYPADFPLDLLDVMAERPNVCRYLDIALQHGSDKILSAMRRKITVEQTRRLLDTIRKRVPGIHIRTTMMTGFPGEDEEAFEEMMQFVKEQRFERLGAFAYCEEEETYAARHLKDDVPEDVKHDRLDRLMALQEEIASEIAQQKVGQTLRVKCDREEADYYICRTEFDSPEVDPEVLVTKTRPMQPGCFYDVMVRESYPFELIAEQCH